MRSDSPFRTPRRFTAPRCCFSLSQMGVLLDGLYTIPSSRWRTGRETPPNNTSDDLSPPNSINGKVYRWSLGELSLYGPRETFKPMNVVPDPPGGRHSIWAQRSPTPSYAKRRRRDLSGWRSDRGRLLLQLGKPPVSGHPRGNGLLRSFRVREFTPSHDEPRYPGYSRRPVSARGSRTSLDHLLLLPQPLPRPSSCDRPQAKDGAHSLPRTSPLETWCIKSDHSWSSKSTSCLLPKKTS